MGESRDYGFRFNLLSGRLSVSLLHYETSEIGTIINGSSVNAPHSRLDAIEDILLDHRITTVNACLGGTGTERSRGVLSLVPFTDLLSGAWFFAAAAAAPAAEALPVAAEVERWFDYPLIRLGEQTITVLTIAKIFAWVTAILVLNVLFQRMILRRVLKHTRLALGLQFAIAKMFGYVVVILGFYVALVANGVNLSSLAVVAGALGLGLGFGLQNFVANFVSGIVLLAERPLAVGDRIEVNGVAGRVSKISLRATTVITNDNIAIIVPNSDLTSHPVTNWSHGGPRVRMRLPVGVAYGTDPERLRTLLLGAAATHKDVLSTPAATLYFDGFGENALNFELAVWTETMTHSPRRLRSELNFMIERTLRENRIEIPFPQRVVHIRTTAVDAADEARADGT